MLALLLGLGTVALTEMRRVLMASQNDTLRLTSQLTGAMVSQLMQERALEIDLLRRSETFVNGDLKGDAVRQALEMRRSTHDEYLWLGVASAEGVVQQGTSGVLVGESVSARPWFAGAQTGPYAGDVHPAVLLESRLPKAPNNESLRFIDFASPIVGRNGQLRGVLAAHASWAMVSRAIELSTIPVLGREGAQLLILANDGRILYPRQEKEGVKAPALVADDSRAREVLWPDGKIWLTSVTNIRNATQTPLNWRVVIRSPFEEEKGLWDELESRVRLAFLIAALLALVAAYGLAGIHSGALQALVASATAIREKFVRQTPSSKPVAPGHEIDQIATALAELDHFLEASLQAAKDLEATIQHKVQMQSAAVIDTNIKLAEKVTRDPLTGLKNRREFDERLQEVAKAAARNDQSFAILFMDLDHFKRINDTYGHNVGDEVLRTLAKILVDNSRASDTVARYGGEEFVVLLPNTHDSAIAIKVAEKIRQAVESSEFGVAGKMTISVGVSCASPEDPDGLSVVKRADEAMYLAKNTGRNRVQFMAAEGVQIPARPDAG